MRIAGIDWSMSAPAICIHDTEAGPLHHNTCAYFFNQLGVTKKELARRSSYGLEDVNIYCQTQNEYHSFQGRIWALCDWAIAVLRESKVEVIALEDYAFAASGRVFHIAECTGLLKHYAYASGIPIHTYSPTTAKKVFAGNGRAKKPDMIAAYNSKYDVNFGELFGLLDCTDSPIADMVDAHAILYTHLNQ